MRLSAVAVSMLSAVLLAGCAPATGTGAKSERVDVPIPVERSADVTLAMRSGDIRLAGGAAGLLEGVLVYDASDAKPAVASGSRDTTAGKVVTVAVEQGDTGAGVTATKRAWDLQVNGGLPTNLDISSASGNLDLDLKLADPKLVDVSSKSGDVTLAIAGPHPSLSRLAVEASSGNVDVKATGEYPALEGFLVTCASGDVNADLAGTWRKDFTAEVSASSGDVTLVLPRDVNVTVLGRPSSGNVSAEGFEEYRGGESSNWRHRPEEKPSETDLTIVVKIASGNLTLKLAEKK